MNGRNANLTLSQDCGQQVSKSAAACPHCGRKLNQAVVVIWFLLAVVIFGLLIALYGGYPASV